MGDIHFIITLVVIGMSISLLTTSDLPILTFLSNAFLGASIAWLACVVLSEANEEWNDDMLASYAFLESLILIALGFRYLVQQHDAQHDAIKR